MLFLCALLPSELQGTLRGGLHSHSGEANGKTTNGLVNKDMVQTVHVLHCRTLVVSTPACFLLYWLYRLQQQSSLLVPSKLG
jgi:hypothetical protein